MKQYNKKNIVILVLLILLITAIGISVYLYNNIGERDFLTLGRGIDLSAENYSDNKSKGVSIPCFTEINLKSGKTGAKVELKNPKANEGIAYLQYSLILEETGETLYTSGLIQPGKLVKNIELSRPLEEGEYKAIFHVQPFSQDEELTQLNSLNSELTLKVRG